MKTFVSAAFVIATLASSGCSSTASSSQPASQPASPTAQAAAPAVTPTMSVAPPETTTQARRTSTPPVTRATPNRANGPKNPDVSILKLSEAETPAAVRAIERVIDRRSALLADEVRIEVSKNYEWDVSLTGDKVSPHHPENGGTISFAEGNPRAYFRNLDIRARDKITIWRSGLGVTPFIRIHATGTVSYIDTDEATGKPRVKRAGACRITNSNLAFEDQILGIPTAEELSAKPAGDSGN